MATTTNTTTPINLDASMTRVKELVALMKTVKGFDLKRNKTLPVIITDLASAVSAGDTQKAIELGGEFFAVGRSVLGAFLRNSVIDPIDATKGTARFTTVMANLNEENYHEDIVAHVEKLRKELIEAVNMEREGDFTKRITAYNAVTDAIQWASREQIKRDRSYKEAVKAGQKKGRKGGQAEGETAEAQANTRAQQRAEMLAQRQAAAAEIASFLD